MKKSRPSCRRRTTKIRSAQWRRGHERSGRREIGTNTAPNAGSIVLGIASVPRWRLRDWNKYCRAEGRKHRGWKKYCARDFRRWKFVRGSQWKARQHRYESKNGPSRRKH